MYLYFQVIVYIYIRLRSNLCKLKNEKKQVYETLDCFIESVVDNFSLMT